MKDAAGVRAYLGEDWWPELQELQVCVKRAEAEMAKATNDAQGALNANFMTIIAKVLDEAKDSAQGLMTKFMEARGAELKASMDACQAIGGKFLATEKWYKGAKNSDTLKVLEAKAKGTLDTLDVKEMIAAIAKLKVSLDKHQTAAGAIDFATVDSTRQQAANAMLRNLTLLKVESALLWHLGQERDHDALRLKVQAEIRELRACGFLEREALHPGMFRRAHEALVLKHKK